MRTFATIAALAAGLALSACAGAPVEQASRNAPVPGQGTADEASQPGRLIAPEARHIASVRVRVPRELTVSEANRFYPGGDIVWREDPRGDRHEQVRRVVEAGIMEGVRGLGNTGRPAVLDIEVSRFHALTEKARRSTGGVHAIQFTMQMRDAETGAPLGEPKFVKADFKALGGQEAARAEAQGLTQKVRITRHLAQVIRTELTDPEGYHAANLGLIGALNQL